VRGPEPVRQGATPPMPTSSIPHKTPIVQPNLPSVAVFWGPRSRNCLPGAPALSGYTPGGGAGGTANPLRGVRCRPRLDAVFPPQTKRSAYGKQNGRPTSWINRPSSKLRRYAGCHPPTARLVRPELRGRDGNPSVAGYGPCPFSKKAVRYRVLTRSTTALYHILGGRSKTILSNRSKSTEGLERPDRDRNPPPPRGEWIDGQNHNSGLCQPLHPGGAKPAACDNPSNPQPCQANTPGTRQ